MQYEIVTLESLRPGDTLLIWSFDERRFILHLVIGVVPIDDCEIDVTLLNPPSSYPSFETVRRSTSYRVHRLVR